ncbi:nitrate transporter [Bradyrhizobium japonicum]|uniref:Nitrate transporter n=1 Tax=Bradyrhizobium japonicum TaxID=375 RepID=A0A0A3Y0J0_BRAJP|nr:MFS transporter [Bradyrhizobium japonicum]KGT79059.1 nitrate transporter [Bradyrhizobium japonicum]MCS3898199.1 NNP family nitrate/nitrite transporter-like MFS transporter [Bradyrhizobium japonicum USDA 38]MCS3941252.1 NNP family nitrate/nitrite transporter-like MFS transporter [Bradyrhizobium japonicum]MCW2216694.1 NNP family nitrate/nitrite transporter-like MFS transporter [Bradyrhizobium japonicum]MCW2341310.1 NNP family nitrate/nitrite transporter-like MFS transporter [Bradyrhizobium ja
MTTNPTRNPTWISDWRPEDEAFWNAGGKVIARRNLIWSIVAEHIGFSVWLIWSIVTTKLPQAGFHYTTDQLFQLVAVPGLIGALMRFPYTFAVTTFGGRNWTIFSAAILFIPTLSLAYFVSQPDTPFWLMLLIASTAGLGGGNFASSMTNISFFFPDRMKGWALGLNAAGGNIGVSSVQLLTPILMTLAVINLFQASPVDGIFLQNAGLMWVLPIAIAVFGAVFFMNNLTTAKSSIKNQLAVVKRKHTWIMAYLYIGTFGSFIGYSAAFPLLIKTQFPAISISIAFLGPLVGSLSRPLGGLLADKIGGSILTFWNFIAMAAATVGVLYFVGHKDFTGFLAMFLILFVTTGIGNGSTYRMIPSIFREQNLFRVRGKGDAARAAALKTASIESGAAVGFIGAIGAVGGYLIPTGFGKSIAMTGGPSLALAIYLAFYASCLGLTWWFYLRRSPQGEGASSLAEARV